MSGIMFNEDCTHFTQSRFNAGKRADIKELQGFIDQYAGTQVKEFVMNVNAMLAWFPSKTRENAIDKYADWPQTELVPGDTAIIGKALRGIFIGQGLDMFRVWIDRLRENAVSPWLSIRMNDIHNANEDGHFLVTQFYRDHKNMRRGAHRPLSSYFDAALDYSNPEVREHYMALIREVAERYDFDGLELDWLREPFTLGIGAELDGTKVITDFMWDARKILDQAEITAGHRIKMSVRVPYSPEVALRFGFDVLDWARSGLVDAVIPTPRWQTVDNDMPIDLWKKMLSGTGVMLCAGLEVLIGAERTPIGYLTNSLETARGSAAAYLGMGADRIYLFNFLDVSYFDAPKYENIETVPPDSYAEPANYRLLLTTLGDLETAAKLPRRHVLTFHDITAPGMKFADILPAKCAPRLFFDARITTGPIPADAKITLVVGVDIEEELDSSDFSVFINSTICIFEGACIPPNPKPVRKMYSFTVQNRTGFPQASIIEIASNKKTFSVVWMEIDVN